MAFRLHFHSLFNFLPGISKKTSFLGIRGRAGLEAHPPSPQNESSTQATGDIITYSFAKQQCHLYSVTLYLCEVYSSYRNDTADKACG